MTKPVTKRRTTLGRDLEAAFGELAAFLRGEVEVEQYEVANEMLTPLRIQAIRRGVASSTKDFERSFGVPARTMEAYEQGRRKPDAAMTTLLRIIEREPEAARRAMGENAA